MSRQIVWSVCDPCDFVIEFTHGGSLCHAQLQEFASTYEGFRIPAPNVMLTLKTSVAFLKGAVSPVLLRNFFEPEDGFVWSTSTWSEIIFAFSDSTTPRGKSVELILDLDVFKAPPRLPYQTVLFYLNGLRIGSRDVRDRVTATLTFNPALLRVTDNVLTLDTPNASVPSDFGVSDSRCLGVQLFSLQLRPGV